MVPNSLNVGMSSVRSLVSGQGPSVHGEAGDLKSHFSLSLSLLP